MRSIFIVIVLLGSQLSLYSQNKAINRADKFYGAKAYVSAIENYKKAYMNEVDRKVKAKIIFRIAECYRFLEEETEAVDWYKKSIKLEYYAPVQYYQLFDVLKSQNQLEDLKSMLDVYLQIEPKDSVALRKLENLNNLFLDE